MGVRSNEARPVTPSLLAPLLLLLVFPVSSQAQMYSPIDSLPVTSARIGEKCIASGECPSPHSICYNGICVCDPQAKTVPNDKKEVCYNKEGAVGTKQVIGGYCETHSDCAPARENQSGGYCVALRCAPCQYGTRFDIYDGKCKTVIAHLGDECEGKDGICYLHKDSGMQMVECRRKSANDPVKTCQCIPPANPIARTSCRREASGMYARGSTVAPHVAMALALCLHAALAATGPAARLPNTDKT